MSHLVARILLAIFMLPLGVVAFVLSVLFCDQFIRPSFSYPAREAVLFGFAAIVTWGFVAGYWLLLWRKSVRWTRRRRRGTWMLAVGLLWLAVLASFIAFNTRQYYVEGTVMLSSILVPLLWLIGTVLLWCETPLERAARFRATGRSNVSCPTCGYNLTGLSESRCPECGSRFTLDELLAAQPAQSVGEME